MNILKIIASSFASLASLFLLTKLMGNREMAQLSMFDYISSIAIGSIAGEMAVMSTGSIMEPLVSMFFYSIITILISYSTCKSIRLRRFIEGDAILLYQNGQIFEKNLLKVKLDIDELLSACRLCGYYDLNEVHTVYLESNGKISVLPAVSNRPTTPSDFNLTPTQTLPLPNVIIDGRIMNDILKSIGKNETWIENQLELNGVSDIKDVILATFDITKNKLNIYKKFNRKMLNNIFE